uniref:Uncharacterized protein n=1 Tax=Nelumbo nucifera TaxID=4432 RepID=A0A822Z279_NELNU|nr:TPA_asm: hypothetical protein HUJ06_006238 [Nelumbo nucifera]
MLGCHNIHQSPNLEKQQGEAQDHDKHDKKTEVLMGRGILAWLTLFLFSECSNHVFAFHLSYHLPI